MVVLSVVRSVPGYSSGRLPVWGDCRDPLPQWATVFGPIDSCKPLVLSQDEVEEEKERDTKEENGDVNGGSNQSETDKEAADKRRRAKEEEANAEKDLGTEKAKADSPEKTKKIQP